MNSAATLLSKIDYSKASANLAMMIANLDPATLTPSTGLGSIFVRSRAPLVADSNNNILDKNGTPMQGTQLHGPGGKAVCVVTVTLAGLIDLMADDRTYAFSASTQMHPLQQPKIS